MLIGIHPLLTPDLLHAMASMGHGDAMVIADANFPSVALSARVITLAGATATQALDAILTRLPLDEAASPSVFTMAVSGDPTAVPDPVAEFAALFARKGLGGIAMRGLDRHEFYGRARQAFAIVRTGDLRRYGNILLVKGVVNKYTPA